MVWVTIHLENYVKIVSARIIMCQEECIKSDRKCVIKYLAKVKYF